MSALATLWRSIWRFHWLLAGILVLEYALAFAIVMVAVSVLVTRMHAINQSSGIEEQGLYVLRGVGVDQPLHRSQMVHASRQFAALAGRSRVAMANGVPFGGHSALRVMVDVPGDARSDAALHVDAYQGDRHLLSVLGLRLLHGRGFHADEVVRRYGESAGVTILSRTLAQRLFRDGHAVGRQVTINGDAATVIGVVAPLAAPRYVGPERTSLTLLVPQVPAANGLLLLRYGGASARLDGVLERLQKHDRGRVRWRLQSYPKVRAHYFRADNLVVYAFAAVIGVVLVTAVCGVLGLTRYWIGRRRRQIAIRRALGAKRRDILALFLAESGLLVAIGIGLGVVLRMMLVALFSALHHQQGIWMWLLPVLVLVLLAACTVYGSLRRWLRLEPVELIRSR